MNWEDITIDSLLTELRKCYPDILFKEIEDDMFLGRIDGKISKDIFIELWLDETDYDIWKSNRLIHVGVVQRKGTLQGHSCAVDNFEDLNRELAYCIHTGKEWAGEKNIRKKLI